LSDSQVKELIEVLTSIAEDFLQNNSSKVYWNYGKRQCTPKATWPKTEIK
jgi:hypothetical protein